MSICLATLSISLILPHAVDENLVSSTPNYIVTVPSCIAFHHDDYPDANIPELLPNLRTRPSPPLLPPLQTLKAPLPRLGELRRALY